MAWHAEGAREPIVTILFSLIPPIRKALHCVFNGTQYRALCYQRAIKEILNISFPRVGIEPTTNRVHWPQLHVYR